MVDGIKKNLKIINRIFMALAILLIVVVVSLGFLWNGYLNKNSLLKKFETTGEQEVYLLGTLHKSLIMMPFIISNCNLMKFLEKIDCIGKNKILCTTFIL